MRIPTQTATAAAAAILALAAAASAACPTPTKLTMIDAQGSDAAGAAISMSPTASGVSLMVGAPSDNTPGGLNAGSVYTFGLVNGIWGPLAHIYAGDALPNDFFGTSIAYADPYAVIGADGVGLSGAAYFFERFGSSWQQVAKVFPEDNESGADMGHSVAISGLDAIVGAPLKDQPGINTWYPDGGAAYVYRRSAGVWTLAYTINWWTHDWGGTGGDQLGTSVDIGGDLALAGAPYGEYVGSMNNVGYVEVHRRDVGVWAEQGLLTNPWASSGDLYGASVATDGTFMAAGAPDDDLLAAEHPVNAARTDSGCVVIHRWDLAAEQWYLDGRVFASDPTDGAHFGSSVALRNGRLVVGAEGAKKVYIFRRDGASNWVQEAVLSDPDSAADGTFGSAVAFDGTHVASGDYGDDHTGLTNPGAVYIVSQPGFGQGGDLCTAPTAIPGHGEYVGCTELATLGGSTTCGGAQPFQGPDVWYSWTPTCSGNAIVDTIGSDFDTVLSIHTSCPLPGQTNTIVCNDDAGGIFGLASLVTFDYTADTTYLIRVAGYNLARGDYTLRVWEGVAPSNDDCASPQLVTNGSYTFATCMATTAGPAINGCNGQNLTPGQDVWFRYSAACTGTVTIDLCGSNFDTVVGVYLGTGCPTQPGTAIACSDDSDGCGDGALTSRVSFPTIQGFQYTIRVGGFAQATGTAVMDVSCTGNCPADWDGNGRVNSSDISAFLTAWLASVQNGTLAADFNDDQAVNSTDISAFLTQWLADVQGGC